MATDQLMRRAYEMIGRSDEHLALVDRTARIIADALSSHRRGYVGFSGGKDSTVLLDMVLRQAPEITVWNWDYGREMMPAVFQDEIIHNARNIGARDMVIASDPRCAGRDDAVGEWYRVFFQRISALSKEGYDLALLGIRGAESGKRRRRGREQMFLGMRNIAPLYDWTARDVWAYIVANGLPYHSHYERYGAVLPWEDVRFSTYFDNEMERFGADRLDGLLTWRHRL